MRGILDILIYIVTAPLRLFGRSRRFRLLTVAVAVVGLFFAATLWALNRYFPATDDAKQTVAKLEPLPPLQPLVRQSYVIAPVAVSIDAIQRSLDASAPRQLSGKNDNPLSGILSKADIGMTITRGNIAVNGKANELAILTQLNGSLKVTGQLAAQAGNLTGNLSGTISGLLGGSALGGDVGKAIGGITSRVLDQNVEIRSQVTVHSKPALNANWRLEPNLRGEVAVSNSAVQVAGLRINMANEAKTLIDRAVNDQMASLDARLRNDTFIERSAREEWAKMCRSIPLGGGDTGLPRLWLEMKPVRAVTAQPRIDARNVTLAIGVSADTRITPAETKPQCPFPASLELVPPMETGKLSIGLPIDVPFSELNKLMNAQLKGKRYPEGTDAPVEIEVLAASLAASGDKVLISLADNAVIDLTPFLNDAKAKIGAALADFRQNRDGVAVDATVDNLRLTGIAFDSNTLRVIAEAEGTAKVAVTQLPKM